MPDLKLPLLMDLNDEYFMRKAIGEAIEALNKDEVPIGAVIVMNDKIIARGHNQTERLTDSTAHAEIIALTSCFNYLGSKYLPDATIYITVEPCLMCAGALYWSKIGRIVYGTDDEKNGYRRMIAAGNLSSPGTSSSPFHPRTQLVTGILKEECASLMKNFFKTKR